MRGGVFIGGSIVGMMAKVKMTLMAKMVLTVVSLVEVMVKLRSVWM